MRIFISSIFISYVERDSRTLVEQLVESLRRYHLSIVWDARRELRVGDSLSRYIGDAILRSKFAVTVLSPSYMEKPWTRRELGAILAREETGELDILPVLHGVDEDYLKRECPFLADKLAVSTREGVEAVVRALVRALKPTAQRLTAPHKRFPSAKRVRLVNSCRELLACWNHTEEVVFQPSDVPQAWVLKNPAAHLSASLLRRALNNPNTLIRSIFMLYLLWVAGIWLWLWPWATVKALRAWLNQKGRRACGPPAATFSLCSAT